MRNFFILIMLLTSLSGCSSMMVGGGGGSSASGTASSGVSDAAITQRVRNNLAADPAVSSFTLGVRTDSGKVTLTGTVSSYMAYDQAERVTMRTDGVKSIDNGIKVNTVE